MRKSRGSLVAVLLGAVALGACQREQDGDLRQAYDRMLAQAEQRAADQEARRPPAEPPEDAVIPMEPSTATPPAATPADQPEEPAVLSPEPVEPTPAEGPAATLRDVRVGQHAGFDRVVFEFDAQQLPAHEIDYVTPPIRDCGTGATVPVAGERWIRIRFEGTRPNIANRDRSMQFGTLRQLTLTCDSGARAEWVLGVTTQHSYRALELGEPTRLVMDLLVE